MIKESLGDLCNIVIGRTPARKQKEYWGKGQPWVSISDMKEKYIWDTKEEITEKAIQKIRCRLIPKGTLLFSFKLSIGKMAFASRDLYTNEAIAGLIIKDQEKVYPDYLYYSLKVARLLGSNQAAMGKTLNSKSLAAIQITLPSEYNDQIRIATLLSRIEALIATRKANLNLLDEFLKSTFLEMFGDPINNEKGFPVRQLKEFYIDPKNGTKCGPFGSALKKNEYVEKGVPVWNMDNITIDGRMNPKVNLWITENKFSDLNAYSTRNGDVIISRAGTVGKMCVLNTVYSKSIISTNLIRVRFGEELIPIHFVSLMTYCKGRVGKLRKGADGAFSHMNTGILDKLTFPYPPLELQTKFSRIVEKVGSIKSLYQQNLNDLENLYGSVSQKAFKGELDLSHIPLPKKEPEPESKPEESSTDTTPIYTKAAPDNRAETESVFFKTDKKEEQLFCSLFNKYLNSHKGKTFTFDDYFFYWAQHEEVDDNTLGIAEYELTKKWLYLLIKNGSILQEFDTEKHQLVLKLKG